MLLGYNTNGFAHHLLEDAIAILADMGYASIALSLDHHALNPYDPDMPAQRRRVAALLERRHLHCVIETGARFLLDPRNKHSPTLLDSAPEARERRVDFLLRAVEMADALHADAVSFWSGVKAAHLPDEQALARLADGCRRVLDAAEPRAIRLAFEPEPGMFIDTTARFAKLHALINHPLFGLTLDIGHVHCRGDGPIAARIEEWKDRLFNIHIEDMRRGVHDHLPFGQACTIISPSARARSGFPQSSPRCAPSIIATPFTSNSPATATTPSTPPKPPTASSAAWLQTRNYSSQLALQPFLQFRNRFPICKDLPQQHTFSK
jgi:L-ribulose-5-phosphate 3-epimerase